jgi:hypothetical protein
MERSCGRGSIFATSTSRENVAWLTFENEGKTQTIEARFLLINFGPKRAGKNCEPNLRTGCY